MPLGTGEIILIALVILVIFGSTKLPQLGDGLGRAIKNFKRAVGGQNEIDVSPKVKKELRDDPADLNDPTPEKDKAARG